MGFKKLKMALLLSLWVPFINACARHADLTQAQKSKSCPAILTLDQMRLSSNVDFPNSFLVIVDKRQEKNFGCDDSNISEDRPTPREIILIGKFSEDFRNHDLNGTKTFDIRIENCDGSILLDAQAETSYQKHGVLPGDCGNAWYSFSGSLSF